jgi:AraC-like DNA-binding protein
MIIALGLGVFLFARLLKRETHWTLLALIAVCAIQSAVVALTRYYGVAELRPLQAIFAMVVPPVAWLAFIWASGKTVTLQGLLPHAAGPLLALVALSAMPMLLDIIIPLSFLLYGAAILMRLRRGEDGLPHSRLDDGPAALWAWRILGLALIASAACDIAIAVALSFGQVGVMFWLPSLVSSLSLLSLGAVSLTQAVESRRDGAVDGSSPREQDTERDQDILARVDTHMAAQKAYLDPDLTLARLARRLVVPAKQLSGAINRGKRENVSRYINRLRIEEACRFLDAGKPVTTAMFESGFNTKSNFNREFLRIKKMSPREWLVRKQSSL